MKLFPFEEAHFATHDARGPVLASSEKLGWSTLFATIDRATASELHFEAVANPLIVVQLGETARIVCVLEGEKVDCICPRGSVTLIPAHAEFDVHLYSNIESIILYLRHELLEEIAVELVDKSIPIELKAVHGAIDLFLEQIAHELRDMLNNPASSDRLYVDMLAQALSCKLLRHYSSLSPGAHSPSSNVALTATQRNRVRGYIESFLDRTLNLRDLARETGLGQTQFSHRFKVTMGCPPYEYVMRARVERAKRLIASSNLSLADIALRCGFTHQQHMTCIFTRRIGVTPGALRRMTHTSSGVARKPSKS